MIISKHTPVSHEMLIYTIGIALWALISTWLLLTTNSLYEKALNIQNNHSVSITDFNSIKSLSVEQNSDTALDIELIEASSFFEHAFTNKTLEIIRPIFTSTEFANTNAIIIIDIRSVLILFWFALSALALLIIYTSKSQSNTSLKKILTNIDQLSVSSLQQPILFNERGNVGELQLKLEKLRQRLNENSSEQLKIMRHISHELKTPLTSIKEGTKLLEDELLGPITNEQREITKILSKNTLELQHSIEELLDYNAALSDVEVRNKHREDVNLVALINQIKDKHAISIKSKNIKLELKTKDVKARVNKEQIKTILDNLLSNAIKFSPKYGTVSVKLETGNKCIILTVQDDGDGVSINDQKKIFNAFYVGSNLPNTTLKGTGLGLSIAQEHVKEHQGSIKALDVESGAAFQVILPI